MFTDPWGGGTCVCVCVCLSHSLYIHLRMPMPMRGFSLARPQEVLIKPAGRKACVNYIPV